MFLYLNFIYLMVVRCFSYMFCSESSFSYCFFSMFLLFYFFSVSFLCFFMMFKSSMSWLQLLMLAVSLESVLDQIFNRFLSRLNLVVIFLVLLCLSMFCF